MNGWSIARGAVTMALAWSVACGADEPPPVTVARQFANAVQRGDVEEMLELVEDGAVQRLREAAARASDQVGGRRNVEPHEMLQIVDVDPRFQVADAELLHGDDSTAVVQLTGADGSTHDLSLVAVEGEWRVRIALPAASVGEP